MSLKLDSITNPRGVILFGAGGHGRVVVDCLRATGLDVLAVVDDDCSKERLCGIPVVTLQRVSGDLSAVLWAGSNPTELAEIGTRARTVAVSKYSAARVLDLYTQNLLCPESL